MTILLSIPVLKSFGRDGINKAVGDHALLHVYPGMCNIRIKSYKLERLMPGAAAALVKFFSFRAILSSSSRNESLC